MVAEAEGVTPLSNPPKGHSARYTTSVAVLTDAERSLVEQLKAAVAPIVEQHACLKAFCNDHTYVRYLRARQWNLAKAQKMLKATLEWRLEYKPHLIKWEDVQAELTTGKQYIYHASDKNGRPIVFMRPRNENSKDQDRQIRALVYNLEHASRLADQQGVGKMCWLLDFEGYSMSNAPPLRVSLHCNSVFANHYPERLGCALCYHAPTLFSFTWKAVKPFIDPVTKEKIVFVDRGPQEKADMESRFDMTQIEQCMGGSLHNDCYDHAKQGQRQVQLDAEVAAEIKAMEQAMATGGAVHMGDAAAIVSPEPQLAA